MSEHTPGPWTIKDYADGDDGSPVLVIHSDQNNRVCFLATAGSYKTRDDELKIAANARLIAAAPDMLAALKRLAHPHPDLMPGNEGQTPREQAIAAIRKATTADERTD